jgi:hypothetical protein
MSMGWQSLFDGKPGRVIDGNGYSVRLFSRSNLRYSEGSRSITILTDIVDESDRLGRKWGLLPNMAVVVYLPTLMKWDDGSAIPQPKAETIIARIQDAITAAGERFRLEFSDAVYEQAERDWRQFVESGPQH